MTMTTSSDLSDLSALCDAVEARASLRYDRRAKTAA